LEIILKGLIGLQYCDTQVRDIQNKKKEGPIKIQRLADGLNVTEKEIDEKLNLLEACKREKRQVDQDIEVLDSNMGKSDIKLSGTKSNKEYSAVLKEIDELKKEKAFLEDRAIEIMEEVETLEKECAKGKKQKSALKKKFEKDREVILKEMKVFDKKLKSLEKEKIRFFEVLDEDLLKRYNLLKEHRGGLAISPVIKGVCQACHIGIPPQKFNELIRGDVLMSCPNCKRMIYWGEDERFQAVVD